MKIGSANNGINIAVSLNKDVQNKPTEVKTIIQNKSNGNSEGLVNSKEKITGQEIMNDEMLSKAIAQANKSLEPRDRRIERAVHEVTHVVMYTIKDIKTDEVIAEFPPRKIQDMIAKMWELAGLFVDEQA